VKNWSLVAGGIAIALVVYMLWKNFNLSSLAPSAQSAVEALSQAITKAENSPVDQTNNPGDLVLGDVGNGIFNSAGVTIFSTLEDGIQALYNQVNLIFTGQSKNFNTNMTIAELAQEWTGGDQAASWAATVAQELGVTPSTTIADWLAQTAPSGS
jgi:hypothetical protein